MPLAFLHNRLYIRHPDAIAYVRGRRTRGTVAFYRRWHGLYAVAHQTGEREGLTLCTADGCALCGAEEEPKEIKRHAPAKGEELMLLDSAGTVIAKGRLKG